MTSTLLLSLGLAVTAFGQKVISNPLGACSAIATSFTYPNVNVNFTEFHTAGSNVVIASSSSGSCGTAQQAVTVDICRVRLSIATSAHSHVEVEAWLPTTNWTGRFLSTGNGGLGGCIQFGDIAYGNDFGFATVGSNNGHDGSVGMPFYQNPDVVHDFASRAIVVETQVGQALVNQFYGQAQTTSIYLGCSTGGRQGFKMAQDFPTLFDGIVAGCPALDNNHLNAWSGRSYPILQSPTSPQFVSSSLWALIWKDVMAQCDLIDGAADNILEDPSQCVYKPDDLKCAAGATDTSSCLTTAQYNAVVELLGPYMDTNKNTLIFPPPAPGTEKDSAGIYYTGNAFSYTQSWFRYAILEDPTWDPITLNSTTVEIADSINPFNVSTFNTDLSAFQQAGGKILHYHGQSDPIISPLNSNRYYEAVKSTMAMSNTQLDDFYRFFRVSGLGHCSGGPGAWNVGQGSGTAQDPQHDVLARIISWVEGGAGPDTITGVGAGLTRNHCKYPLRNKYVGPGALSDPTAWSCVA